MIKPCHVMLFSTLLPLVFAGPALAQATDTVEVPPGPAAKWVDQEPTRELGTDGARVLASGLSYISAGGGLGGSTLAYARGLGRGGQIGLGLDAVFTVGTPSAFAGAVSANWKQQVFLAESIGVAVIGTGGVTGLGGTMVPGLTLGLPVTFEIGNGSLTAEPRVALPNVTAGTAGAEGELSLGYHLPLIRRWAAMLDVAPAYTLSGEFKVPLAIGLRFSPSDMAHVDFTLANLDPIPAFGAKLGLVNVIGHVGF